MQFVEQNAYIGRVLEHKNGYVLMEETSPGGAILLPHYVMGLNKYTERECRCLSRAIAQRIRLFHEGNVVHRKLHLENILVESHVSADANFMYSFYVRLRLPLCADIILLTISDGTTRL